MSYPKKGWYFILFVGHRVPTTKLENEFKINFYMTYILKSMAPKINYDEDSYYGYPGPIWMNYWPFWGFVSLVTIKRLSIPANIYLWDKIIVSLILMWKKVSHYRDINEKLLNSCHNLHPYLKLGQKWTVPRVTFRFR